MSRRDAAARYARAGWRIFPTKPDKAPYTTRGFHDASARVEMVEEWWERWPDANIGLDIPEGTVVLDFDPRNGAPESSALGLPPTQTAATPAGGQHLYYSVPGGLSFRGTLVPGVDVKAPGKGYVLLPPSKTEEGEYRWLRTGVVPMPEWTLARIRREEKGGPMGDDVFVTRRRFFPWEDGSRYGKAVLRNQVTALRDCKVGSRNNTLFKATAQVASYIAGGHLPEGALEVLRDEALDIGLEMYEVMETMRSAYERGIAEPKGPNE